MQIRCKNCRMPINIHRELIDQTLNIMQEENLVHFDFRCPNCKKNNKASHEQLLRAAPGWEYLPPKKPAAKAKSEPKPAPEPEAKVEPKAKAKAEPKPKAKAEPKPKAKAEPKPKAKAEPKPKTKAAAPTKKGPKSK